MSATCPRARQLDRFAALLIQNDASDAIRLYNIHTIMRAMVLFETNTALKETELPEPTPSDGAILVKVEACADGRTDLHVIDGELPNPKLPIIPGHEIVGRVISTGHNARRYAI